jgi:hypothetical protein
MGDAQRRGTREERIELAITRNAHERQDRARLQAYQSTRRNDAALVATLAAATLIAAGNFSPKALPRQRYIDEIGTFDK